MKRFVIDASVAIKWLMPTRPEEDDVPHALALLAAVERGEVTFHQPTHFLAEVLGVVTRLTPHEVPGILRDLLNTEFEREESPEIYTTAAELSVRLNHHLFDTLYHAVALHAPDATLVTADRRYFDKARNEGSIVLLKDLRLPE